MRHGMINPRKLKVGRYAACMVEPNGHLAIFTGLNAIEKSEIRNGMKLYLTT